MTKRRPSRREAYLLGALLVVASAAPLAMKHLPWIDLFTRGPSLIDLESPILGPVSRAPGELVVAGDDRRGAVLRTPFAGVPGRPYLLRLRRGESAALAVNLIGPGWSRLDGPYQRAEGSGVERIILIPSEVPPNTQLGITFSPPANLRITELELYELAPSYPLMPLLAALLGPLVALVICVRHWRWLTDRAPSALAAPAWDRMMLAAAIFLVCFLAFYQAPVDQVVDARYLSVVSHALLTHGTTAIPVEVLAVVPERAYQLERAEDHWIYFFAHAPAMLNAPFVWLYGLFGVHPVDAAGYMLPEAEVEILRFSAAVIAAGLCLALYGIARRWLVAGPSVSLVAVFAFGTQIFSTISRPYWSHAWASLLLAAAVYLLVAPGTRNRPGAHVAIGSLLAWAVFCRPSMALSVVAIAVLVATTRRRYLPHLLISGLLWLIPFVVHSQQVFGSFLPDYFLSGHLSANRLNLPLSAPNYPRAVTGTLFSPSRGLFVYVPFLVLVLWGVARRWSRLSDRALAIAGVSVIVVHWQLVSSFRNWWGGAAFGPRLFSDVVVWFFVLAALALAAGRSAAPRRAWWRHLGRLTAGTAVAFSLFVHYRGATAIETRYWPQELPPGVTSPETERANRRGTNHHQRQLQFQRKLWDWRDPQFLAGLLDRRAESE